MTAPDEARTAAYVAWRDEHNERYAAWQAAGRPMHQFVPGPLFPNTCDMCGGRADSGTHPPGVTSAQALAELDSRPSTGPGTGLSEMIQPVEVIPLRRLARARRWELQQGPDVAAVLDAWYERYWAASRIDEDVYLALRNQLIPLEAGDPVQFQEIGKMRWFNGTFEGPVDKPGDPWRSGDVTVLSRSGRRVSVFLGHVRRRAR